MIYIVDDHDGGGTGGDDVVVAVVVMVVTALLQDVVDSHPGLTFLQDAPEFHSRYVQTVS